MKMNSKTTTTIALALLLSLAFISMASALTIQNVETSKTDIQPGDRFSVDIEIENTLSSDAEDVVVSLDLTGVPFAPYQSSNQVMKAELNEDDSKVFSFELIAGSDADSGVYKIPVNIVYQLGSENKTANGLISIVINAQPQLDVSIEGVLIKGQTKELTIRIVNSGLGEARLLSLKVIPVSGLKIIGSDSVYIGNIESDDFDSADFQISVPESVPGTINLIVELAYRDSKNKEFAETKYLPVKIYTRDEAIEVGLVSKSNTLTYVIVVVVLIVVWLIWRAWRKRRKRAGRV